MYGERANYAGLIARFFSIILPQNTLICYHYFLMENIIMNKKITFFFLILSSVIILLTLTGCVSNQNGTLKIENNQNQEVSLWVRPLSAMNSTPDLKEQGVVPANSTKSFNIVFTADSWADLIQVNGQNGTTLFSQNYTMSELSTIKWKIAIPASNP